MPTTVIQEILRQEDTAGLFKHHLGRRQHRHAAEGDITHLHLGFKGTMNALFLKDLAEKTHRGLRGRIEDGKSAGGLCYGYRVVKALNGGTVTTGEREIDPAEAAVVERIFREFVAGVAPKAIAKRLNRDGIAGPFGGSWSPSTIHGNPKRGTGILNNELYVGRMVWNRLRYVKNPDTGKRISRLNPKSDWIAKEAPSLRIVNDELWAAAKVRQSANDHPRWEHWLCETTSIPLLGPVEVWRMRRWVHHGRPQSSGVLRRSRQRHLRQPPHHQA
jgi:site-specific DNA recombinase